MTQREEYKSAPLVRATWFWSNVTCHGAWRNKVCVYGKEDIPHILNVTKSGTKIDFVTYFLEPQC